MKKGLLALGALFAICLSMLATDMVVKQKNGEDWKINVDDVEEVFFEEKANIPDDSTVIDASETFLLFNILSDSTAEVDGLKIGGVDELIIPAKVRIDGKVYTVTSIKDFAFDTNYLGSVMIPSSITKLYRLQISTNFTVSKDNPAFSSLDGVLYDKEKTKVIKAPEKLKGDLVIPESVTSIEESAFYYCVDLTNIKIPEGVTSIGAGAFSDCSSLTSINIPEGVTSIGESTFFGCASLTSINIPEGVTSIGDYAFYGCSNLTSINIPEGVTSIGEGAFYLCNGLDPKLLVYDKGTKCYGWIGDEEKCTEVVIPEGVTSIGASAFYWCNSLASIKIPEGVTSIGEYAFYNCSNLTSINIPEGVTSIGEYAFYWCSNLTSINIPEGVTSIGEYAFYNCSGLTSINIPKSVTTIGRETFCKCSNLTSVNIPEGVKSIGTSAFSGCSSLDVVIDNSKDNVKVGKDAFYRCKSVTWLKE